MGLVLVLVGASGPARAAELGALKPPVLDAGGGRGRSTDYTVDSSFGFAGGWSSATGVAHRAGFIGELNEPPETSSDTVVRGAGASFRFPLADLLANDRDLEGDPLAVVRVLGGSARGGTVSLDGDSLVYVPPDGAALADTVTVSVGDGDEVVTSATVRVVWSQTITFATPADRTTGSAPFAPTATASSGLAVQFEIVSGPATLGGGLITLTGTGIVTVRASQTGDANFAAAPVVDRSFTVTAPVAAAVVARKIFYNRSAWDGNNVAANASDDAAIATDKAVLLPGQKAGLANYTSYSRGINGLMIDVANPGGTPTAADFTVTVGNDDTPNDWTPAPAPTSVTMRSGAGMGGSTRITLLWADGVINGKWLRVVLRATANTGLPAPDVFYFGNAIGETGNRPGLDAIVNATDEIRVRSNPKGSFAPAPIDFLYDINRDKLVNATDQILARLNTRSAFTALRLISVPLEPAAAPGAPALASPSFGAVHPPSPTTGIESADESSRDRAGSDRTGGLRLQVLRLADGRVLVKAPAAHEGTGLEASETGAAGSWVRVPTGPVIASTHGDGGEWVFRPSDGTAAVFFRLVSPDGSSSRLAAGTQVRVEP